MIKSIYKIQLGRGFKIFNTIPCGRDVQGNEYLLTCEATGITIPKGDPGGGQESRTVTVITLYPDRAEYERVTPVLERWKPVGGYIEYVQDKPVIVSTLSNMDDACEWCVGLQVN